MSNWSKNQGQFKIDLQYPQFNAPYEVIGLRMLCDTKTWLCLSTQSISYCLGHQRLHPLFRSQLDTIHINELPSTGEGR